MLFLFATVAARPATGVGASLRAAGTCSFSYQFLRDALVSRGHAPSPLFRGRISNVKSIFFND